MAWKREFITLFTMKFQFILPSQVFRWQWQDSVTIKQKNSIKDLSMGHIFSILLQNDRGGFTGGHQPPPPIFTCRNVVEP